MKQRHGLSIEVGTFARTGAFYINARCQCGARLLHSRGLNESQVAESKHRAAARYKRHMRQTGAKS